MYGLEFLPDCAVLIFFQAKFFMVKSTHALDVKSSIAHNTWISNKTVNDRLDKAFIDRKGPILLFFSIIGR